MTYSCSCIPYHALVPYHPTEVPEQVVAALKLLPAPGIVAGFLIEFPPLAHRRIPTMCSGVCSGVYSGVCRVFFRRV